ncbi:nucleotidyltransferase [Virgibacillus sp. Bac332]|uniref:nucleotidyltransferase n=1 Tax=Virgibacillus sp. Bac332 TaxID=2419842 RepID=UPI000EF5480D|nr:nucleotidyltransferase [Virgibacillus sp. Bac332]
MEACGLVVEYNPFHNGHVYHIQEARKISQAECMIAVMSGSFLQRGEPAIMDKFYRARAALSKGIDLVVELPYPFAVQSSDLFAKGAVLTLSELGVSSLCFGSESGNIDNFINSYHRLKTNQQDYQNVLRDQLNSGISFPEASKAAYRHISLSTDEMDLTKPNNILGFSYVKTIMDHNLPIRPLTVQRSQCGYHDETISGSIASATSIRKTLTERNTITHEISNSIPDTTKMELENYNQRAGTWHVWENYFPFLHYRVTTMSLQELSMIQGVDEGLEHRLKKAARSVHSFGEWMQTLKTKRYTWTRLQRMFVHILTNTKKKEIDILCNPSKMAYVRVLGFNKTGQAYIHQQKKKIDVPLIQKLGRTMHPMLEMEERASDAYYSILAPDVKLALRNQEIQPPIKIL